MRIKAGADLNGVHFMLWYAAAVFDALHQQQGFGEAYVTSGRDIALGRVSNTLHADGGALDFRRWQIPSGRMPAFLAQLRQHLGPAFEVILEDDHIHVELAPWAAAMVRT